MSILSPAEFYNLQADKILLVQFFCNFLWKIILCVFMSFYISKLFCTVGSSNLFSVVFIIVTNVSVRLCDAVKSGRKSKWNTQMTWYLKGNYICLIIKV